MHVWCDFSDWKDGFSDRLFYSQARRLAQQPRVSFPASTCLFLFIPTSPPPSLLLIIKEKHAYDTVSFHFSSRWLRKEQR